MTRKTPEEIVSLYKDCEKCHGIYRAALTAYEEADKNPVELKEGQIVSVNYRTFTVSDFVGREDGVVTVKLSPLLQWEEVSHDEAMEALKSGECEVETYVNNSTWDSVQMDKDFDMIRYTTSTVAVSVALDRKWRIRKKN